jgi:hypothetical protein
VKCDEKGAVQCMAQWARTSDGSDDSPAALAKNRGTDSADTALKVLLWERERGMFNRYIKNKNKKRRSKS